METIRRIVNGIIKLIFAGVIFIAANNYVIKYKFWMVVLTNFVVVNLIPSGFNGNLRTKKLKNCDRGYALLEIFLISTLGTIIFFVAGLLGKLPYEAVTDNPKMWIINTIIAVIVEAIVFWNGMIRIYLSSDQLGVKWRGIGAVCGMIPVVNLVVLGKLIGIVKKEVKFENDKIILNEKRHDEQICKTKYPLLMVHGVFFRDYKYFNYWGRIPEELEANGATIFYGNQQSAASVEECAKELDVRVRQIVAETGCEKVNIIAHSKGGLDSRYALSQLGTSKFVASLTTINTPHRGCEFADYLLSKIPKAQKEMVAAAYNGALKKLCKEEPDFLAAVTDLTAVACKKRNEIVTDVPGVLYQSVGSKLNAASGGRFPLNFSYQLVKCFDGYNDGLVGEKSFPWGSDYTFIEAKGKRGISHGDVIDLNRENFDGFDVREFYVKLVSFLRKSGL